MDHQSRVYKIDYFVQSSLSSSLVINPIQDYSFDLILVLKFITGKKRISIRQGESLYTKR